jgi:hypothetical protein
MLAEQVVHNSDAAGNVLTLNIRDGRRNARVVVTWSIDD